MTILLALLTVPAPACEGGAELIATIPPHGAVGVPTNAVATLVFESEFESSGDSVLAFLVTQDDGHHVLVTRYGWTALDASGAVRRFIELEPPEPLAPTTRYDLHIADWATANAGAWGEPLATFTTSTGPAAPALAAPHVELLSTTERGGQGDCEAPLVREHRLRVTPPVADPSGLGLLHVSAVTPSGSGGLVPPDFSITLSGGEVTVAVPAEPDSPSCVVAVWQGPDGSWSEASPPACDAVGAPIDTGEHAPPIAEPTGRTTGGGGCATVPRPGAGLLALLALPLLRRRAR